MRGPRVSNEHGFFHVAVFYAIVKEPVGGGFSVRLRKGLKFIVYFPRGKAELGVHRVAFVGGELLAFKAR